MTDKLRQEFGGDRRRARTRGSSISEGASEGRVTLGGKPRRRGNQSARADDIRSEYSKLVLFTVAGISGLALIVSVVLAVIWITPTANQQVVFDSVLWLHRFGFGTIIVKGIGPKLTEAIRMLFQCP